ncbi:hypothetical protein MAPG_01557 [Magnaporthiopsis poae ATCC 64411]|uniref:Uncharacterized protein n=1 Tax=Magnaporthiopsis poae (strain ATCC 64411 / 73-15) TaxID=644358 RepID=A0A0C4DP08_MAGP6|nr:hypothetical protein MAPG_01557 [Magnaporthiopsis poae ATCC 64411]
MNSSLPAPKRPSIPQQPRSLLQLVQTFLGWGMPSTPTTVAGGLGNRVGSQHKLPGLRSPNPPRSLPSIDNILASAQDDELEPMDDELEPIDDELGPMDNTEHKPDSNGIVIINHTSLIPSHTPLEDISWDGTDFAGIEWIGMSEEAMQNQNQRLEWRLNRLCSEGGRKLRASLVERFGEWESDDGSDGAQEQPNFGGIHEDFALFTAIDGAEKHEPWPSGRLGEETGSQCDPDKHHRTKQHQEKHAQYAAQFRQPSPSEGNRVTPPKELSERFSINYAESS